MPSEKDTTQPLAFAWHRPVQKQSSTTRSVYTPAMAHRLVQCLASVSLIVCGIARADTLNVSVSGTFGAGVTTDAIAAPAESWALGFDVDMHPAPANPDVLGFDAPFSNFTYTLNGAAVAVTPEEVRFETTGDLGLFTVYFGPESGFVNGSPIPIFSFEGAQAFSDVTTAPTILAGIYPVTDVLYTDASNFDDEGAGGVVTISTSTVTGVPEPSTVGLLGSAMIAVFARFGFRGINSAMRRQLPNNRSA